MNNPQPEMTPDMAARRMLGHSRPDNWGAPYEPASPTHKDGESWMVAYLDLITLLLTLFVILGSLSHAAAGVDVRQGLERAQNAADRNKKEKQEALDASVIHSGSRQGMEQELHRVIGSNSLGGVLDVKVHPGRIRLQMDAKMLFATGSAALKPAGRKMLAKVAELFASYGSHLSVEGHTDNVPINGGRFHSNWELSSARAVAAVEALESLGVPRDRLRAVGLADTRPVAPNDTPEGRAHNRRVDFVMELGPEFIRKRPE